jgi:type I restriction enzyme M protein|nr:MAG TPA: N-6 DNA Methylase [Caudoviricetes sp.]
MKELLKEILKCRETSEIPKKLLDSLLDADSRENILRLINDKKGDEVIDVFRDIFQEEQSNRKELKQDYTPDGLSNLLANLSGETKNLADVCAGTGSLTVAFLKEHPEVEFVRCEEFSAQPIPFLLLNLALMNVDGEVVHGDSLTQEVFKVYKLKRSKSFSEIQIADSQNIEIHFDTVISNPPYSLKWQPTNDDRFEKYGLAPASKADFAFVLHALSLLKPNGNLFEILPHGVLFRGGKEGKIRKQLLEDGVIASVIGLPGKLFLNTAIPTAILNLKKERNANDVLFIDASKEFKKGGKQNILEQANIERIIDVYNLRKSVDRFAYLCSLSEIKENDFNLNIPRYVDTYEPEEPVDLEQVLSEWLQVKEDISETEEKLLDMFYELVPTNKSNLEKMNRKKEMFATIVHATKPIRKEC